MTLPAGGAITGPSAPTDDSVPVLIAPGGWQLPTEYVYEFSDVPFPDPLVLPYLTITRGGIRYPVGPVRRYRWYARSRWGWRIKRVLFGVQWIDT